MTQELIPEMVGYKIFNEDLTCRDFQFKEGIINELGNDRPLELCKNGFHFCIHPSGVWAYYNSGRVFKVRAYEVFYEYAPGADLKCVCRKIELLEEIPIDGNLNTGYGNTGDGNVGNKHAGYLNIKPEPVIIFDKVYKGELTQTIRKSINYLCTALSSDKPFDYALYIDIPNATEAKIKKLHKAHIEARKKLKEK
jgi:hypothetical protein